MFRALLLAGVLAAALASAEEPAVAKPEAAQPEAAEPDLMEPEDVAPAAGELSIEDELMIDGPEHSVVLPSVSEGQTLVPGRSAPVAGARPMAYELVWDRYRTVLVVGEGRGRTRPAWIATFASRSGRLAVAYRAIAFQDAAGFVHFDARMAVKAGPMAREWSPDSFAIIPPHGVATIDDQNRGNQGSLSRSIDPAIAPEEYRRLLGVVQAAVANSG